MYNTENMSKRLEYIDALRGLAILLVVFMHVPNMDLDSLLEDIIWRWQHCWQYLCSSLFQACLFLWKLPPHL